MRTFFAVNLPPNMLDKVDNISKFFMKETSTPALKWVEKDNLHLTIKFIGEVSESKVEQVKHTIVQSLQHHKTFEIEISGLGMYPHQNNPRVVWLGIINEKPLIQIAQKLDQTLTTLDIKPEQRAFSPHLTIARVRRNTDKTTAMAIGKTLSNYQVDPLGAFTIDRVVLYQSQLTPTGPVYSTLHTVHLNQV